MPEPQIDRIKTEVYFTDVGGVEWQVVDARWRRDGKLRLQYPGIEDAQRRYFIRYSPIDGANARRPIQVRRYRFEDDDSRWFQPDLFQLQLDLSQPGDTP